MKISVGRGLCIEVDVHLDAHGFVVVVSIIVLIVVLFLAICKYFRDSRCSNVLGSQTRRDRLLSYDLPNNHFKIPRHKSYPCLNNHSKFALDPFTSLSSECSSKTNHILPRLRPMKVVHWGFPRRCVFSPVPPCYHAKTSKEITEITWIPPNHGHDERFECEKEINGENIIMIKIFY